MKKRMLCAFLSVIIALCAAGLPAFSVSGASYADQINELERKQSELKKKISALQDDIDEQEALRDAIKSQIDNLQEQIDIYNVQITDLEDKTREYEKQKAEIEADIEVKKELFLERVRAMYIAGSASGDLSVLLGADEFSDYLYQTELLESVTEYDNTVMDELRKDIEEIDLLEKEIEEQKAEVGALKSDVLSKQSQLSDIVKQYNSVISGLESQQGKLEGEVKEYGEQIDALEDKIAAAAAAAKKSSVSNSIKYDGSQFTWPCPGYYYISSPFGPRWGRNHNGCDIAGSAIYGKPIVAAADGQVTLVGWNGGGYGNYVMVNHGNSSDGNNYVTLYAHMSRTACSEGQHVSAGQTIGYVGSTGYSTGPHLHFEIRVNGSPRNPLGWFNSVG